MNLAKYTILARKIHRFFVLIVAVLGMVMSATGMIMNYPRLSPINPSDARQIHGTVSFFFGPVLGIMSITGLFMYLYPWLQKIMKRSSPQ